MRRLLPTLALLLAACGEPAPELPPLPDLHAIAAEAKARHPEFSPELSMVAAELDARPDDAQALARAARLLQNVGRMPQSRDTFARALALAPDDPEVLHHYGSCLLILRELEEALPVLERVRELDTERALVHLELGEAYLLLGREEDAIASYERARDLAPSYVEATYQLALLVEPDDPQRALQLLTEVTTRDPYHLGAHANLVPLLERLGDVSGAERARERHVELALLSDLGVLERAEEADRYLAQAQYYAKNELWDRARVICRDGLTRHPVHPELHYLQGIVDAHEGEKAAARDAFLRSLELRPGDQRVLLDLAGLYAKGDPPEAGPEVLRLLAEARDRWPEKKRFARALSALGA